MILIRRALVSVYDKNHLDKLAKTLALHHVEIIATGSTYAYLTENDIPAIAVQDYTGFPEILHGRVKTLQAKIFGGILARPLYEEIEEISKMNIPKIDLVVVNLYPFVEKSAQTEDIEKLTDEIDIGGVSLIRAAAKNFQANVVLSDPEDYIAFHQEMKNNEGKVSVAFSKEMMKKAFYLTSQYDWAIFQKFSELDEECYASLPLKKKLSLRYGENPHQNANYWVNPSSESSQVMGCNVLHGKELSYNNLLDISSGLKLIDEFNHPSCAIIKHSNPCGVASADQVEKAHQLAFECDPVSAFGGIYVFNQTLNPELAKELSKQFIEIIIAPSYHPEALEILKTKKNLRLLERIESCPEKIEWRSLYNGFLSQEVNHCNFDELTIAAGSQPTPSMLLDIHFGIKVSKHITSNAMLVVHQQATLGIGVRQCNRVQSTHLALEKAGEKAKGAILIADGFLPFADSLVKAAQKGIKTVVEPGGSIKDKEVIDKAKELGIGLIFTHFRHFKH